MLSILAHRADNGAEGGYIPRKEDDCNDNPLPVDFLQRTPKVLLAKKVFILVELRVHLHRGYYTKSQGPTASYINERRKRVGWYSPETRDYPTKR